MLHPGSGVRVTVRVGFGSGAIVGLGDIVGAIRPIGGCDGSGEAISEDRSRVDGNALLRGAAAGVSFDRPAASIDSVGAADVAASPALA
jgi:hypothetical protein